MPIALSVVGALRAAARGAISGDDSQRAGSLESGQNDRLASAEVAVKSTSRRTGMRVGR